jgi:hypothetical protein
VAENLPGRKKAATKVRSAGKGAGVGGTLQAALEVLRGDGEEGAAAGGEASSPEKSLKSRHWAMKGAAAAMAASRRAGRPPRTSATQAGAR